MKPVRKYRPNFAAEFTPQSVEGVPAATFKFRSRGRSCPLNVLQTGLVLLLLIPSFPIQVRAGGLEAAYADVLNGPASETELYAANGRVGPSGCAEPRCLALHDVADAVAILRHRDVPGGPSLLDPGKFNPHALDQQVDGILRAHPERNPYRCAILTKIARHAPDEAHWPASQAPGFLFVVFDIASRITTLQPDCLQAVAAALPNGGATRELLPRAREFCAARKLACDRVGR